MKTVKLYETGDEVLIKAEIVGIIFDKNEIKYKLKNPLTGHEYGFLFTEDQLIQDTKEKTDDIKRRESH